MKVQPNEYGVTWATSKAGKVKIAVGADTVGVGGVHQVEVWALYAGTHDVVPVSRRFKGADREAEARSYANQLWGRY